VPNYSIGPHPGATTVKSDTRLVEIVATPPKPKTTSPRAPVRASATFTPGSRHRSVCAPGLSFSFSCKSCGTSGFSACQTEGTRCPSCHTPLSSAGPQDRALRGRR